MPNVTSLTLVIISGLSGAGKSLGIRCLEDCGFFCVDNLPSPLLLKFVELCTQEGTEIRRVGLGIDVRERGFLQDFLSIVQQLRNDGVAVELLFLEADDDVLLRRFSESRRPHPLAQGRSILEAIRYERDLMKELRRHAGRIIDTSHFIVHDLKAVVTRYCLNLGGSDEFTVSVVTFGYKYGIPYDVDLLFDVRFLRNPYFVQEFRNLNGEDQSVRDFVLQSDEAVSFLEKVQALLWFVLPLYKREGKHNLTIGIGCTGGRHRSVSAGIALAEAMRVAGYTVALHHRDLAQV